MKLSMDKQINENVYSVDIKFSEYGSSNITLEEEKELIQDFAPQFNLRDIVFKGNYIYDDKEKIVKQYIVPEEPVVAEGENTATGDTGEVGKTETLNTEATESIDYKEVSLIVTDKVVSINENLELRYVIKSSQILDEEVGNSLNNKGLVAQAKVQLFEDKIIEKITKIMNDLKARKTNFEKVKEVII